MDVIPVKTPKLVRALYPNYLWSMPDETKSLYLTFDDGPTEDVTNFVLKTLKEYGAKGTFFCIGKNIEQNPKLFNDIITEGHSIGNHTQDHVKGWKTTTHNYLDQVEEAQRNIQHYCSRAILGEQLFRPPYGKLTNAQANSLIEKKYKIVMWDVLSFDWKASTLKEDCLKKVVNNSSNGSIIVFHDSKKAYKNMSYALPKVLEHFSNQGFQFKKLESK